MKKPEAIFFDWDGTLVDTFDVLHAANNHVQISMGKGPLSKEEARKRTLMSTQNLYPKLYPGKEAEAMRYFYAYIEENHLTELKKINGADTLLSLLKEDGISLGVASNKKQLYLEREINHMGWHHFFEDRVIGAGVAERDKPAPDPILELCRRIQLSPSPEKVWYIGDTETDYLAATKCSCTFVLINEENTKDFPLELYHPEIVLKDCFELTQYYKKTVAAL